MISLAKLPWKPGLREPLLSKEERLLHASLPHRIRYFVPFCLYLFFAAIACSFFYAFTLYHEASPAMLHLTFFVSISAFLLAHHWFFHTILSVSVSDIILTNKRILYLTRSLWFDDTSHDIAILRIKAVEVHKQTIIQNLLNYGDLWFDTGGSTRKEPHQTIHYVPSPQTWADEIIDSMRNR